MTDRPMTDGRDLIDLAALGREGILEIIERARVLRELPREECSRRLAGREVVHLFLEPSTRTRVSFEIAAGRVGATIIDFDAEASSLEKGESLLDTVATIEAMGPDALVVRHREEGAAAQIAATSDLSILNAGDGARAHPTQGLLDLLTLLDEFGDLEGRRIAIVGDVRHSRVARSSIIAFQACGARIDLVAPPTLCPAPAIPGPTVSDDLEALLPELDAVMMLRIQRERLAADLDLDVDDFVARFRLDAARLRRAPDHLVVLHPGPMNRGVEVTDEVADGPRSRILRQVATGVAIRMAALEWCLGGPR